MSKRLNPNQDWLPLAQQANWSVTRLAKLCTVSRRTLERHFLKTVGKAPKTWLIEQRHKQATELLHDGSSVKEVASLLGYQHATTFAREFKKFSGQCPNVLGLAIQDRVNPTAKCRIKLRNGAFGYVILLLIQPPLIKLFQ